ncbi:hypothetical protein NIES4074_51970 [Cylindrospermum sp. NIES-4074]|nr:hypothetical protein NIES4074_51970 [Cylindrospermum sp. NIES-4074]
MRSHAEYGNEEKENMNQENNSINSHITEYLDYYCGLSAPGFAVLLKGEWGSGKTWFINKYREKLEKNNQKCVYVSLYGMTSFSEIEDTFFQQLHPVLSSKGMAITGKIFKGLLKGTLKIDLDGDSKDDGALNIQVPEINLPEYLKNTDKSILIFDDLERCQMDIGNILGYINYFVEQQGLKVVIIANEDELLKQDKIKEDKYKSIKEKLIGKTFNVVLDFNGALEDFICSVDNTEVRNFLSTNTELIEEVYKTAECENLRILKQIVLDFERIFKELPEKARSKPELLKDFLKLLMAFSIEIRRGTMLPKDISKLEEEYVSLMSKKYSSRQAASSDIKVNNEELTKLEKILSSYTILNLDLHEPFPSKVWWERFFDKGILDRQELDQSLLTSRYFQDENTPNWVRLYHYQHLTDDEFDNLLKKVESEYADGQSPELRELRVIQHITGLFLRLSDTELYSKSKEEILQDSKSYIDKLKDNNQLDITYRPISSIKDIIGVYDRLDFQGKNLQEFKDFSSYIEEVRKSVRDANMPNAAQDLLVTMQSDVSKFCMMICPSKSQVRDISDQRYDEIPILKYTKPTDFMEKLLHMKSEDQESVIWAIADRYELVDINKKLLEELDWLKSVRNLLPVEAARHKGKLTKYRLKTLIEPHLNEAIERLEAKSSEVK